MMIEPKFFLNPSIEIKETEYPVYFDRKNICIHCGAENSLEFVDKFGNIAKSDIHPFEHIKCKKCGRRYSILWQPSEDGKLYPSAIDMNIKKEFVDIVKQTTDYLFAKPKKYKERRLDKV